MCQGSVAEAVVLVSCIEIRTARTHAPTHARTHARTHGHILDLVISHAADQLFSVRVKPMPIADHHSIDCDEQTIGDHASVRLPGVLHTNVGHSNFRCVIFKKSYHLT